MFGRTKTAEMVTLLVDHLDKVIVTAERLADARFRPAPITSAMSAEDILAEHARLREFLAGVRALEMTLAARVDKARTWTREVRGRDGNLKLIGSLFLSGTQALAEAMAELGDPRAQQFDGGEAALGFLKSRGLVAEHVENLDAVTEISAAQRFVVAGRAELSALSELCHTFIETLDVHYGVLEPEAAPAGAEGAGAAAQVG